MTRCGDALTKALCLIDRGFDRTGRVLARFARPVRDGLIIVGLARAAYYFFVQDIQPWTFVGVDARAYWQVDLAHPYLTSGVGGISSFLYSPAFAQVLCAPWGPPVPRLLWTLGGRFPGDPVVADPPVAVGRPDPVPADQSMSCSLAT